MTVMIIEHETVNGVCRHCNTPEALYEKKPTCVPRWSSSEPPPRHINTGQSGGDFAADDAATISARLIELEAERLAARNTPLAPSAPCSPQQ